VKSVFLLLILVWFGVGELAACPVCDTETGREVRAEIFGTDFVRTLLSVLAPFPVLLAIIGIACRVPGLLGRERKRIS